MLYWVNASFYFITEKGLKPNIFGLQQSLTMGINFVSSLLSGHLMEKIGVRKVTQIGLYTMFIGVVVGLFGSYYNDFFVLTGMILFMCAIGLSFAGYISLSLERHQQEVGTASALTGAVRSFMIAVGTGSAHYFYNNTLSPSFMLLTGIALVIILMYVGCYKFIQPQEV